MLILTKIKGKSVAVIFWVLLIVAFIMGVLANIPEPKQPRQVNIPLYPVQMQQQELIDRGHDIAIDGIWGPDTDLALTIELTKGIE